MVKGEEESAVHIKVGPTDPQTDIRYEALSEKDRALLQSSVCPVYRHIPSPFDHKVENDYGARIVLTKDRHGNQEAGYARTRTFCAAIDMSVGPMSMVRKNQTSDKKEADPSFKRDAARIYISEKADIDEYFSICHGMTGRVEAKSGIGIKADGVRIIGRENVKIVTGTDSNLSGGGKTKHGGIIELLAGNDDRDVQQLVKGKNLVDCLDRLANYVSALTDTVNGHVLRQTKINISILAFLMKVANHQHMAPPFGGATLVTVPLLNDPKTFKTELLPIITTEFDKAVRTGPSLVFNEINLAAFKQNYFNPIGSKFVLSRNCYTN